MKILRSLLVVFTLYGYMGTGHAGLFLHEIETTAGVVTIGERDDDFNFKVKLNGKVIATIGSNDGAVIDAAYGHSDKPELLLLRIYGGNSCPGSSYVLDLTNASKPQITEQFGYCEAQAQAQEWNLEANPSSHDGAWHIANSALLNGAPILKWYRYEDGKIYEDGIEYKEGVDKSEYTQEEKKFCIAKNSVDPESPSDKIIDDTLSWIHDDGFDEVAREDITWKYADYNHDGKDDLYVYFKHNGSMGDYGSAYLSSPVGNKCPANSWCYAGTGFSVFIDKGYTTPKCEEEYAEFTLPD